MSGIEITNEGAVQVLRFARPQKKNALDGAMYRALCDAIETGEADDAVAVHVLLGTAGVFTAGNDIGDFLKTALGTGNLGAEVLRFIHLLPTIEKPLIAGVDGIAVGIGTTLLFHCDLVFATQKSTFATPFLDLGLVPEAGSSLLAPRVMGHQRAYEMLVYGAAFSAERALAAGLINAIAADGEVEAMALDAAQRLAAKPRDALRISKRLLKGDSTAVLARTREEALLFRERLGSAEARAAFEAFFQRRG